MNENFSEELKKEFVKQAIKNLDVPFKILTVKDVAKDLNIGEKTNEIFNCANFPSVNIDKTKKYKKLLIFCGKWKKGVMLYEKFKNIINVFIV